MVSIQQFINLDNLMSYIGKITSILIAFALLMQWMKNNFNVKRCLKNVVFGFTDEKPCFKDKLRARNVYLTASMVVIH